MEIKITVDESQFKEVLEGELKALKPEEIHEVLVQCIGEYFRQNDYAAIKGLLVENPDRYGWDSRKSANVFTQKIIESCDMSGLQDVVDKSLDVLKNDYKELLNQLLLNAIMGGLMNKWDIDSRLRETVTQILWEREQNQN